MNNQYESLYQRAKNQDKTKVSAYLNSATTPRCGSSQKKNIVIICALGLVVLSATALAAAKKTYYCKYCGLGYQTINSLTAADCARHPAGRHKHELYQGTEKKSYECQYCGRKAADISTLTAAKCQRHPKGAYKGRHVPAL